MKNESLIPDFMQAFPELSNESLKVIEEEGYDVEGHIFFGNILSRFLDENLPKIKNESLLKRLFGYLECMACSEDEYVKGVLNATILERLGDDPERLKVAWSLMGEKTRVSSDQAEMMWGRMPFEKERTVPNPIKECIIKRYIELLGDPKSKTLAEIEDIGEPNIYSFISYVLAPYLEQNISNYGDNPFLKDVFIFIESLATSDDKDFNWTLPICSIRSMVEDPVKLRIAWPLMGEKTKLVAEYLSRWV
jgi:hypothetical protein